MVRLRFLMLISALIITGAGCGVPTDSELRRIDSQAIPFGLASPSSSTTSTTTTPPTSSTSTTVVPNPPSTTIAEPVPTTEAPILEPVTLYFSWADGLVAVRRQLPMPPRLDEAVVMLAFGPLVGEAPPDARSALELGDVEGVTASGGVAEVQLAPKFRDLPAAEQRRSVAQLVMTLTSRPGVGQVRFTVRGVALRVPRGDGTFGEAAVSRDDYESLVIDGP